jgi:cyclophilin family peptidyl-prolyl cis-trans isomerase
MEKSNISKLSFVVYIILILIVSFAIAFLFFSKGGNFSKVDPCYIKYQPSQKTYSHYPKVCIKKNKVYKAEIATSFGNIYVSLYSSAAPLAVNNFVFLAKSGFYNHVIFHRLIKGFMIQTGDPTGTGTGGPGYTFKDQINPISLGIPNLLVNVYKKKGYTYDYHVKSISMGKPGILAMANSGPNTNGSQFFITLGNQSRLNGMYTAFGKVTKGMSVITKIANTRVNVKSHHSPLTKIYMKKVIILN